VAIPARATALAIAPDYAGTIWATAGSHVYRSHDGGHTWRRVAHTDGSGVAFLEKQVVLVDGGRVGVAGLGATRLAERPEPRSIVAVATPYYRTNRLYGLDPAGRLWLSVRDGRRWVALRAAGLPAGCGALAAVRGDPLRPDAVYVACGERGIWRSGDFGASFKRLPSAPAATAVATTTDDHTRLLAAAPDGLYLSTDAGRRFRRVARVAGRAAAGELPGPDDLVGEREARAADVRAGALDRELLVEPQRAQVLGMRLDDHHVHAARVDVRVAVTHLAQVLHPPDLEPRQICRVVGDAHRVGLAEADSQVDDGATGPGGNHPRQGNGKPSEAAGTLS
jgi:hypothetical protein